MSTPSQPVMVAKPPRVTEFDAIIFALEVSSPCA
jgi:hypothetical protein